MLAYEKKTAKAKEKGFKQLTARLVFTSGAALVIVRAALASNGVSTSAVDAKKATPADCKANRGNLKQGGESSNELILDGLAALIATLVSTTVEIPCILLIDFLNGCSIFQHKR